MKTKSTTKRRKNKPTRLKVTCTDGTIIQERYAWQTMAKVIEKIDDIEKVMLLHITRANINIITTRPHQDLSVSRYQKEVKPGFYLYTKSSTNDKMAQIKEIKKKLNIQWINDIDVIHS